MSPSTQDRAAGSSRGAARRLTSSVEIVRVRGANAARVAEVQLEAIKEVLAWALSQRGKQECADEQNRPS